MYIFLLFLLIALVIYRLSINFASKTDISRNLKNKNYFGLYVVIWSMLPSLLIFILGSMFLDNLIEDYYIKKYFFLEKPIIKEAALQDVKTIVESIKSNISYDKIEVNLADKKDLLISLAEKYFYYQSLSYYALLVLILGFSGLILYYFYKRSNLSDNYQKKIEKIVKNIFLTFAIISVFTTISILISLFFEALLFFKEVSILRFLFGTTWSPNSYDFDPQNSFGVIPLLTGTFLISFIAVIIATIMGVSSAIYMAEYMPKNIRKIIKPIIELLAGIPSIVYGFFAAIIFSPIIVSVFEVFFNLSISAENALNAGIVMGFMIIPLISSMSDDILNSIPNSIREGAVGIGSMKNEMIRKILLPAALPGIMASVLLAISRSIGETMIVVMASSLAANLTFNPLQPVTTVTTQIVMLVQGDQEFNSPQTLSAFALGFLLLVLTLILNILALKIVNRYKKKYD